MAKINELIGIQYLRAIAALLVVFDHSSGMIALPKYYGNSPHGEIFEFGSIGVDLFFTISGFIIIYTTCPNGQLNPNTTAKEFLRRRFIRIIPFLWLCVIAYGTLKYIGRGSFEITPYLRSLTLFPIGEVQPNSVWTLRHEFLFYLLCLSLFLKGIFKYFPLLIWAIAPILENTFTQQPQEFKLDLIGFLINPINLLFISGVGSALIINNKYIKNYFPQNGFITIIAGFSLLPIAMLMNYSRKNIDQVELMAAICIPLVIAGANSKRLPRILDMPFSNIGNASYAIYLTHEALISAIIGFTARWKSWISANEALAISTTASILIGVAIHKTIETPLINRLKKIL